MLKDLLLAFVGYFSVAMLLLASLLGKQTCTDLFNVWNELFLVIMK
jgi:hypothetical protein